MLGSFSPLCCLSGYCALVPSRMPPSVRHSTPSDIPLVELACISPFIIDSSSAVLNNAVSVSISHSAHIQSSSCNMSALSTRFTQAKWCHSMHLPHSTTPSLASPLHAGQVYSLVLLLCSPCDFALFVPLPPSLRVVLLIVFVWVASCTCFAFASFMLSCRRVLGGVRGSPIMLDHAICVLSPSSLALVHTTCP